MLILLKLLERDGVAASGRCLRLLLRLSLIDIHLLDADSDLCLLGLLGRGGDWHVGEGGWVEH